MPNEIEILKALLKRERGECERASYSSLTSFLSREQSVTLDEIFNFGKTPEDALLKINALLDAPLPNSKLSQSSYQHPCPNTQAVKESKIAIAKAYLNNAHQRLMRSEHDCSSIEMGDEHLTVAKKNALKEDLLRNITENIQLKEKLRKSVSQTIDYLKKQNAFSSGVVALYKDFSEIRLFEEINGNRTASSSFSSVSHSALLFTPQGLYDFCNKEEIARDALDALDEIHQAEFKNIPLNPTKTMTQVQINEQEKAAHQRIKEVISVKTETLAARLILQFIEEPQKIIQILNFLNSDSNPLPSFQTFRNSLRKKIEALLFPYFQTTNVEQRWCLYVVSKFERTVSPKQSYAIVANLTETLASSKNGVVHVNVRLFKSGVEQKLTAKPVITLKKEDVEPLLDRNHGAFPKLRQLVGNLFTPIQSKRRSDSDLRHTSGRVKDQVVDIEQILADIQTQVPDALINLTDLLQRLNEKPELTGRVLSELGKDLLFQDGEDADTIQSIVQCFRRYHQYCGASSSFDTLEEQDASVTTVPYTPIKNATLLTPQNSAVRSTFVSSGSLKNVVAEPAQKETALGPDSERTLRKIAAVLVEIPENQEFWDLFFDIDKQLYQLPQSRIDLIIHLLNQLETKKEAASPELWSQAMDFLAKQLWVLLGETKKEAFQACKNNAILVNCFATLLELLNVVWTHYKEATNEHYNARHIQELVQYAWDMLPDTEDGLNKAVALFNQYPQAIREKDFQYWIEHGMQSAAFKIHVWQQLKNPTVKWNEDDHQESMIDTLCDNVQAPDYLWDLMNTYAETLSDSEDKTFLIDLLINKEINGKRTDSAEKPREIFKTMKVMLACGNASSEQLGSIFGVSAKITFSEKNTSLIDLSNELLVNYWRVFIKSEEAKSIKLNAPDELTLTSVSGAIVSVSKNNSSAKNRSNSSSVVNMISNGWFTPQSRSSQHDISLEALKNHADMKWLREDDDEGNTDRLTASSSSSAGNHHNWSLSEEKETAIKDVLDLLNSHPAGFEKGFQTWYEQSLISEPDANVFLTLFQYADSEDKKRVILDTHRVKPKIFSATPVCLAPEDFMEANGAEDFYAQEKFLRKNAEDSAIIWVHRKEPQKLSLKVKCIDSVLLMQKDLPKDDWKKVLRDYISSDPLTERSAGGKTLTAIENIKQQRNTIYSLLTRGGDKAQWAFDVLMEEKCINQLLDNYNRYNQSGSEVINMTDNILRAIFVANPVKCLQLLSEPSRQEQWNFLSERIHLATYLYPQVRMSPEDKILDVKGRYAARTTFAKATDDIKYPHFGGKNGLLLEPLNSHDNSNSQGMRMLGGKNQSENTQVNLDANTTDEIKWHLKAIYQDKLFEAQYHTDYERMQYYYPDTSDLSFANTLFGQIYRNICLPIYWMCNASVFRAKSVYGVPVYPADTANKKINSLSQSAPSANDACTREASRNEGDDNESVANNDNKIESGYFPPFGRLFGGMFSGSSSKKQQYTKVLCDNNQANPQ